MRPSFDQEELGAAMGSSTRDIVELNIPQLLALLKTEPNPVKRETIQRLLEEKQSMLDASVKKEGD